MGRGMMTDEIQSLCKEKIGREISIRELRLMPYIQYTMMNGQRLEINKINQEEREILSKWKEKGWIEGGASGLSITKEFWDFLNEVMWLGYVIGGAED